MPPGVRKDESMQDADYMPETDVSATVTEKTRGKGVKKEDNGTPAAGAEVNITVHFPVARIKRIMQADDDVGKVAQVTPVVVSKALELFMVSLVTKSAAEAKARNSKRVGAIHLKQAIANDPQFDFLSDIVAKVADAPAATEKSEDAMDVDGGKKRKASSRRKKKADDDDF
ncbi:histone-fold-containing protein [Bimuria novae-zelandiae CBS 107.79]|uniref:NCT transcriptional regulatory complex subunit A n=1 Tax=Bimuria novae-zelandiae CBS 107.79 TaxID=1447943 RepID=A0A6A5V1C4_9PLEO|nr:histone-fold-containing protein [Bimuria novae-zelandiae CBS 107.79]